MNRLIPTIKILAFMFAWVGLMAFAAGVACGQAISGNITGAVVDSSGAAVASADVNVTNINTGVGANTRTNGIGEYRLDNLLIGFYKVTVKSTDFRTTTVQVEVQLNTTATANVTLSPGAANEVVEVSGAVPIIDTTTPQIQSTYEDKQLQDLPTAAIGSGVLNLSLLQSGVGSTGGLGAGTGPSVGGQRPRNNNFTIEGVDNNDKDVTGPLAYVPNDAVANFTVLQNQFNAEFGHSNGGQFNTVVLSGTNTFHGRVYEYFINRNLNAVDQSLANEGIFTNPRFDDNRFGGQVGGPILKNKLFFFANYEYNPVGGASSPGSPILAPTAQGYGAAEAAVTAAGFSTANLQALQKYIVVPSACTPAQITSQICPAGGTVNVQGTAVPVGVDPLAAPSYYNGTALITSMDYNISGKDQIRGRYIYNKTVGIDTAAQLPAFFVSLVTPYHLVALSEYHAFSPTVSNELRVGFNRYASNTPVPNLSFLPTLDQFPNLVFYELGGLSVGPDLTAPEYATQNLYQAVDNVTWVKGSHTLKLGLEGRRYIAPQKFIARSRGNYEYATFNDFAIDGIPDGYSGRGFGSAGYSGDQYGIFWYVNDIWKVRSNFSLNLGVRYEYTSTPYGWTQQTLNAISNVPGLITFGSPQAPKKDFMPRIGVAYSPGSRGTTSIRGGFGMGYDVLYDNIGTVSRPPQIGSSKSCPNPVCKNPFLANGGIPFKPSSGITILDQADARAYTSASLPNNVKYPVAESWNFGAQHVFKSNYTAEVRYVGTRGTSLSVQNQLNVINIATASAHLPTYLGTPSQTALNGLSTAIAQCDPASVNTSGPVATCPNFATTTGAAGTGDIPGTLFYDYFDLNNFLGPQYVNAGFYNTITAFRPWGSSTYHGLQTQLNRRFASGLQFQAAYTFSYTIDNSTADFLSTVIAPRRPQTFRDLPAERANSILDHRHRITLSSVYEVPFCKGSSNWLERNLLGNYEIAPIYIWESGQWGTVQSGLDSNLNGDGASDRAIINPAGQSGVGSDVNELVATSGPNAGNIVAYQAVNPNAKYIVSSYGTLPTSSRNTLPTPPINDIIVTVSKHIALTERYRVELAFTAFNLLNHPQFVTGYLNDVGSNGVTGQGQRNYFIPSAPNFDNARQTFPSNARAVVLGLKFIF